MNEELSDRFLLLTFTTLNSLTSVGKVYEIAYLSVKYMYRGQNLFIYSIYSKVTKSWKRGRSPPKLEFCEFATNRPLCVVFCLVKFLRRSESRKSLGDRDQVLLSHLKPHGAVVK